VSGGWVQQTACGVLPHKEAGPATHGLSLLSPVFYDSADQGLVQPAFQHVEKGGCMHSTLGL
jgi:hypothetical protein